MSASRTATSSGQYDYLFQVTRKNISHFIVEVSPDVTNDQFSVLAGSSAVFNSTEMKGNPIPTFPNSYGESSLKMGL